MLNQLQEMQWQLLTHVKKLIIGRTTYYRRVKQLEKILENEEISKVIPIFKMNFNKLIKEWNNQQVQKSDINYDIGMMITMMISSTA